MVSPDYEKLLMETFLNEMKMFQENSILQYQIIGFNISTSGFGNYHLSETGKSIFECVKCGTRYDDSELICPKRNLYLIRDVTSELADEAFKKETFIQDELSFSGSHKDTSESTKRQRRKGWVHPVEEEESIEPEPLKRKQYKLFSNQAKKRMISKMK